MIRICSVEKLKEFCTNNANSPEYDGRGIDCFISLGFIKSSIVIDYCDGTFYIFNESDDSEQEVEEEDLDSLTNIVTSINNGSLFLY